MCENPQIERGYEYLEVSVITLRRAASTEDLEALFQARHRVFVETDCYFAPKPDGRLVDRYDHLPETYHVIAECENCVVGGVRATAWSSVGLPPFDFFDYSEYVPATPERIGSGSMIFVDPRYRRSGVGEHLMEAWYAHVLAQEWVCVIGVINPPIVPWFISHGWRVLAGVRTHPGSGVPFVPVVLELDNLDPQIGEKARKLVGMSSWQVHR